jgi:polyisoprenoid-binding protein YceI
MHTGTTRRIRAVALLLLTALLAQSSSSDEAPPGAIRFTARNLVATAHGEFMRWRIERALVDEQRPERSVVEVVVELASVDTGIRRRDDHLRSADFFDVERHPTARATLENFQREDPEHFTADVMLDLHGVTKRFPMRFTITDREARGIEGRVTLSRTDFGVGGPERAWNPFSVRDEVKIRVETTVPPAAASPSD